MTNRYIYDKFNSDKHSETLKLKLKVMKKFKLFSIILLLFMATSTVSAQTSAKALPFAKIPLTNKQYADSLTYDAHCFNGSSQSIRDEFVRVANQYDAALWKCTKQLTWDNMVFILKNAKKVKPDGRKLQNGHINSDGTFGYNPYAPEANDSVYEYKGRYVCKVDCCNIIIDESGNISSPVAVVDANAGTDPTVSGSNDPVSQGNVAQSDTAHCCGGVHITGDNNTVTIGTPASQNQITGTNPVFYQQQTPMTVFQPQMYPQTVFFQPAYTYYPYNGQQYYYNGGNWCSGAGTILADVALIAILEGMRGGQGGCYGYNSYGGNNYYTPRPYTYNVNTGSPVNGSNGIGGPVNGHN